MIKFLTDNWLAITSLVVALSGGIPGVLAFIEHRRKRIKLGIEPVGVTVGEMTAPDGTRLTMLMLTITVTNEGERPFVPASFKAAIKWRGKWTELQPSVIPENVHFGGSVQNIAFDEPHKADLQRYSDPISEAKPALGHLMFFTPAFSVAEYRANARPSIRVDCYGAIGKVHRIVLPPPKVSELGKGTLPKHGISVGSTLPRKRDDA